MAAAFRVDMAEMVAVVVRRHGTTQPQSLSKHFWTVVRKRPEKGTKVATFCDADPIPPTQL
jgi:hypothetical protein